MATLVKRSDAPLYRVFLGDDWRLFTDNLSREQCFEVTAVLHAPLAPPDAQDKVTAAICCIGLLSKKNGWFEASQVQAMQVLAAVLVREDQCCTAPSCNACDAPASKKRRGSKGALPVECEAAPVFAAEPAPESPAEETDASSAPDSPQSYVIDATNVGDVDSDPLWKYVVACTAREAAKAADLRAALEVQCGKETSKSLLANTRASVAQDASGKKNRVLKLGASYISLK